MGIYQYHIPVGGSTILQQLFTMEIPRDFYSKISVILQCSDIDQNPAETWFIGLLLRGQFGLGPNLGSRFRWPVLLGTIQFFGLCTVSDPHPNGSGFFRLSGPDIKKPRSGSVDFFCFYKLIWSTWCYLYRFWRNITKKGDLRVLNMTTFLLILTVFGCFFHGEGENFI